MALEWKWSEKAGEVTFEELFDFQKRKFTYNLYVGNAYLITIREWKDGDGKDKYELVSFFLDKNHMKNCLGLNPKEGYCENHYDNDYHKLTAIRLNRRYCKKANEIAGLLLKAFDTIDISVYDE